MANTAWPPSTTSGWAANSPQVNDLVMVTNVDTVEAREIFVKALNVGSTFSITCAKTKRHVSWLMADNGS